MSEAARIRRGTATSRPRSRAVATRPKAVVRKAEGRANTLLGRLPISPALLHRLGRWLAWGVAVALVGALAWAFQLPQIAGTAAGEAIGSLGFSVKHIDARGMKPEHRLAVMSVANDQDTTAMPLIDLDRMREQLLGIGWVRDAQVSRRLPDTIAIRIVEREPAAIWQNRGRLSLIDADGTVLDEVRLDAMPDLPLVIGPAANLQAAALNRLLDAAPTLKPMMAGATWIGGRRWDVRFQSGEVLALPEGEPAAAKALAKFARLDATAGMLGKGLVRFDMRLPGKMYIRMSREPGKRIGSGDTDQAI